MDDRQTNRFEMARTTRGILDQYRAAWEPSLDTVDDVAALDGHLDAITEAARRQENPTTAVTAVKDELRQAVRAQAVALASAVRGWALRRDMTELAGRLETRRSVVDDLRDLDLAEYSEIVVAAAQDHTEGDDGLVARTSVTQDEIDMLDALDDQFADALDTPRAAIIARSRATAQIAEHLSAITVLFDDLLDPEVERLADVHPDFARDYRAARNVVARGGGSPPSEPADADDGQ